MMNHLLGCAFWLVAATPFAIADQACEKRLADTKMMAYAGDEKIICDDAPSKSAQDCMVELLNKGRGKLRKDDLFEVSTFCENHNTPALRECLMRGLDKSWNHPDYKGVRILASECVLAESGAKLRKPYKNYDEVAAKARARRARKSGAQKSGAAVQAPASKQISK